MTETGVLVQNGRLFRASFGDRQHSIKNMRKDIYKCRCDMWMTHYQNFIICYRRLQYLLIKMLRPILNVAVSQSAVTNSAVSQSAVTNSAVSQSAVTFLIIPELVAEAVVAVPAE
jgi:hypothetical protein